MKAIVLSGGKGTRLMPLTKNTPKPMLPLYGTPHLEFIIRLLKKHNIIDIIFSTGYLHSKIVDYFGDGSDFGVNITYKEDGDIPLGTAGAIKNCEESLDNSPFLVFNGDILTDIDLSSLILNHKEGITLALAEVKNPQHFGLAILDEQNRISHFIEKPSIDFLVENKEIPKVINAGIYVMDKEVLNDIPKQEFYMVETDVFPKYANDMKLHGHISDRYWIDIGTFDRYDIANKDIKFGYFRL
jgi:mannose-1-phosphate guanylyltransferase/phosphomannomutase